MSYSTKKIDVGEMFKKTLGAALGFLQQGVIQETSKIKAVQQAVEDQKVIAGKNILWKYFPYAVLAGLGIFMIARVR